MSEKIGTGDLERVEGWIRERTRARCPFCGGRQWSIDDEIASFPALQTSTPRVQMDRGYPMVLITCEGCGFSAPFSAKKLGVSPS